MKCINGVLKLKELKNNYGFFIFFVIIISFFIIFFLFICKFFIELKNQIIQIFEAKKEIKQKDNNFGNSNKKLITVKNQKRQSKTVTNNINIQITNNIKTINKFDKTIKNNAIKIQKENKKDKNLKIKQKK